MAKRPLTPEEAEVKRLEKKARKKIYARRHYLKHQDKCKARTKKHYNKDKHREYCRGWREINREKLRVYSLEYYHATKHKKREILNEYSRKYRRNNPEKVKFQTEKWRKNNPQKHKETTKAYYLSHKETINKDHKNWVNKNRDRFRTYTAKRRARKLGAGGRHTIKDIKKLYELQGGKCVECKKSIKNGYHVDHIMPLKLGGSNGPQNLQLMCARCNLEKHAKHPDLFAREKGRLL